MDFEWSPTDNTKRRDCTARRSATPRELIAIPTLQVSHAAQNLSTAAKCRLVPEPIPVHPFGQATRHTKSKKTTFNNLDASRIRKPPAREMLEEPRRSHTVAGKSHGLDRASPRQRYIPLVRSAT